MKHYLSIEIINELGQIVFLKETNSFKTEVDIRNNPKGMYFIKITSCVDVLTKKLIIQ